MPPSGGTPCDIKVTYTPLNSMFKSCANNMIYLHSFSRCWLPNVQNSCKIPKKFELIAGQGHRSWCQSKAHMQLPISH